MPKGQKGGMIVGGVMMGGKGKKRPKPKRPPWIQALLAILGKVGAAAKAGATAIAAGAKAGATAAGTGLAKGAAGAATAAKGAAAAGPSFAANAFEPVAAGIGTGTGASTAFGSSQGGLGAALSQAAAATGQAISGFGQGLAANAAPIGKGLIGSKVGKKVEDSAGLLASMQPLPGGPMDSITAQLQGQAAQGRPMSMLQRRQAMLEKRRQMMRIV